MGHRHDGHHEGGHHEQHHEQGFESAWKQLRGLRGPGGSHGGGWGGPGWGLPGGMGGQGGPPAWAAGLFGMGGGPEQRRGPRVRRGDVRAAILDVLHVAGRAGEQVNGYQVIQQIAERSQGAWRPSPGSVYPTIQQLQDEGLVETDDERGRKSLRLTAAGTTYAEDNAAELAAVWTPFEGPDAGGKDGGKSGQRGRGDFADLKPEIGQLMSAVWQIVTSGSEQQRRAALDILVDTRRKLYGVLADGPEGGDQVELGKDTER